MAGGSGVNNDGGDAGPASVGQEYWHQLSEVINIASKNINEK